MKQKWNENQTMHYSKSTIKTRWLFLDLLKVNNKDTLTTSLNIFQVSSWVTLIYAKLSQTISFERKHWVLVFFKLLCNGSHVMKALISSYRNQSNDLLTKSIDLFLHDGERSFYNIFWSIA